MAAEFMTNYLIRAGLPQISKPTTNIELFLKGCVRTLLQSTKIIALVPPRDSSPRPVFCALHLTCAGLVAFAERDLVRSPRSSGLLFAGLRTRRSILVVCCKSCLLWWLRAFPLAGLIIFANPNLHHFGGCTMHQTSPASKTGFLVFLLWLAPAIPGPVSSLYVNSLLLVILLRRRVL